MSGRSGSIGCDRPKPVMRHMHRTMALRNVAVAVASSAVGAITFYILYNKRRRAAYKFFYENYDGEKSFQRMMQAGYFSSCPAESDESKEEQPKKK